MTAWTPLIRIWPLCVCIGLKMISTTSRNIQCLSCKHNYLNRICSIYTGVGKEIWFEKTEGNG